MDTRTFGAAIKARRESLGMRVEDVARLSGCSSQTIRNIERGNQEPGVFLAGRILSHLGVKLVIGHAEGRKRLEVGK